MGFPYVIPCGKELWIDDDTAGPAGTNVLAEPPGKPTAMLLSTAEVQGPAVTGENWPLASILLGAVIVVDVNGANVTTLVWLLGGNLGFSWNDCRVGEEEREGLGEGERQGERGEHGIGDEKYFARIEAGWAICLLSSLSLNSSLLLSSPLYPLSLSLV